MSKIYVTASYQKGENKDEIEYLCSLVRKAGFEDFLFIRDAEHYRHVFDDPKDLMSRSLDEIKKSDFLLIDLTDKPTGRAIEAGIAYAFGKKIIVIMKKGTIVKDATKGIASVIIEYDNIDEILEPISRLKQE